MNQNIEQLAPLFNQFDRRKVGRGHFSLDLAPQQKDWNGNHHVCLRIGSVGSSVYHPMRSHIGKLVFSAENLANGKWQLWQYFHDQKPCDPFSVGEYLTTDALKAALETAISVA